VLRIRTIPLYVSIDSCHHLLSEGAAHFLYFVTPASVESRHCKGELQFALSHSPRVVCVHLESTDLPAGLELQLGPTQAILKDELSGSSYEEKLLDALARDPSSGVARVHETRGGRKTSSIDKSALHS